MKRVAVVAVAFVGVFCAVFADDASVSANATLKDGSVVKGEFLTKAINGSTLFSKTLALDSRNVRSLAFSNTNGEARVELANGDKFAIKVADPTLTIKSLLGELQIPRENIRSISFSSRKKGNSPLDEGLVFHCTFDDAKSLETPAVGPFVKLELGKIMSNKGVNGGALFVNPGVSGAEVRFPAGTFKSEGAIEFWANMASGKTEFTTGGDPRFFIMHTSDGNEIANLEFASNNGCGNSGFGGTFCGLRAQTNRGFSYMMPYSDVFKGADYNGWHHYALAWTANSIKIFIDGNVVCSSNGSVNINLIVDSEIVMSIPLNRKTGKSYNNKSAFYMDELKIWQGKIQLPSFENRLLN